MTLSTTEQKDWSCSLAGERQSMSAAEIYQCVVQYVAVTNSLAYVELWSFLSPPSNPGRALLFRWCVALHFSVEAHLPEYKDVYNNIS